MEIKISLTDICVPSADIVSREIENSLVIVPLLNGIADADQQIYTLSDTGLAIWHQLDGEKTLGQVAVKLSEQFSCPLQDIEKDVFGIAAELLRLGICLKVSGEPAGQEQLGHMNNKTGELASGTCPDGASSDKEPGSYITNGGDLSLSNPEQLVLLDSMMKRGVSLRTAVRGYSMSPFIRDRDVLTITPLKAIPLSVGQVVAFSHPENGRLVIHRIIKRVNSGWLLKGDNCLEADKVINREQILGRVTSVERNGQKVRLVASSKLIAYLSFSSGLTALNNIWYLPRRTAGYLLRLLQGLSPYRKLTRRFIPPVVTSEATESDMEAVHRRFNPGAPYFPQKPNLNVTNFIATTSNKIAGFAQLVYHPEDNYPWVGYWLFSLQVWGLYRGMGIGERLVKRCVEEAEFKGASELLLVVYNDNKRAISLDCKLGFVPTTLPALEPLLEAEEEKTGRRRIVMKKELR